MSPAVTPDDRARTWEAQGLRCPACGGRIRVVVATYWTFEGRQETNEGACTGCERRYPEAVVAALRNLAL